MQMYQALANSEMTLNFHIDVAIGFSGNMRMYEATGCGALLITEYNDGIERLFIPDKEIITYKNLDDLIEKIKYFQTHPDEASKIVKAGQEACVNRYGYDKRILDFEAIINKYSS